MRKFLWLLMPLVLISCGQNKPNGSVPVITVSIAPFSYFVEQIAGSDFEVNIMVPAGSNPHIYEPFPEQISKLRSSVAYISNGYLGFEMTWLDRFYEINNSMKKLSLAEGIEPLTSQHEHEGEHVEGADPHYWVSPMCAKKMAVSVKELLCNLNPARKDIYLVNYNKLVSKIDSLDKKCEDLFAGFAGKSFMIYHPNLGYLARDYGLEEISVEFEGKEPPPARLKELIDLARNEGLSTIFVQKEYDAKNARAIADEIGIGITIIDPLSANWYDAEIDIINAVYSGLTNKTKPVK